MRGIASRGPLLACEITSIDVFGAAPDEALQKPELEWLGLQWPSSLGPLLRCPGRRACHPRARHRVARRTAGLRFELRPVGFRVGRTSVLRWNAGEQRGCANSGHRTSDYRAAELVEHRVSSLVGERVFGIALGYEDLIDHDQLRHDPVMAVLGGKLAAKRADCAPLAGKSTLNRLELSRPEPTRYHKISYERCRCRSGVYPTTLPTKIVGTILIDQAELAS